MKSLLKKIVPVSTLNFGRKYISARQITHIDQMLFNPKNLRATNDIDCEAIFQKKSIRERWDADCKAIKVLYGSEDTMGGVNPGDRQALYYLITALAPKNVLEIGTHIGASTLHIACALRQVGEGGVVTSVDIIDVNHPKEGAWKKIGLSASPSDFAKNLGCLQHVQFYTGPCQEFMRTTDKKYDFIFLDGDHTAQSVYKEVCLALDILSERGVLLLHDYYPNGDPLFPDGNVIYGPYMAIEHIKKKHESMDVFPLGTLPWPTKQGTNETSLALVLKT